MVGAASPALTPVIGSRIGGIPDFVHDGVNGLLFAPRDPHDLARCLERRNRERLVGIKHDHSAPSVPRGTR